MNGSTVPQRKTGTFQKSLLKLWDIRGEKTTQFGNQTFDRPAATHTYAGALRPSRETSLQMCIHYVWINIEWIRI